MLIGEDHKKLDPLVDFYVEKLKKLFWSKSYLWANIDVVKDPEKFETDVKRELYKVYEIYIGINNNYDSYYLEVIEYYKRENKELNNFKNKLINSLGLPKFISISNDPV
jgi:hypothetical protein